MCKTPHKHAELIKAWADGATIQWKSEITGHWADLEHPSWSLLFDYRIKPEPKPDLVRYARASGYEYIRHTEGDNTTYWTRTRVKDDNIKATFDGETGKLKKVEMIDD